MFSKMSKFFSDIYQELGKVAYPSKQELIGSTVVVVVMSLLVSVFIGAVDFVLKEMVSVLVKLAAG